MEVKSRRCSLCGISYPFYGMEAKCKVCNGELDTITGDGPDDDWKDKVELAVAAREAFIDAPDKVTDWRMHELFRAGYNRTAAAAIAVKRDIDLHYAVALVREKGCDPDTATKILL